MNGPAKLSLLLGTLGVAWARPSLAGSGCAALSIERIGVSTPRSFAASRGGDKVLRAPPRPPTPRRGPPRQNQ